MKQERYMSADIANFSSGFNASLDKAVTEAVVNSIHAKASRISVRFISSDDNSLVGILIEDNGEGFTDKNIESFFDLHSKHKKAKGGKGVGRAAWLKFFSTASIDSVCLEGAGKRKVSFTLVKGKRKTIIDIDSVDDDLDLKTVVALDLYTGADLFSIVTENFKSYLLKEIAILLLKISENAKKRDIVISITSEQNGKILEKSTITRKDIPLVDKKYKFTLQYEDTKYPFTLYCIRLDSPYKNNVITRFVSGDRTLSSFESALNLKVHAPTSKMTGQYWLLLESPLLNSGRFSTKDRVNIVFPTRKNLWGDSLRDQIKNKVSAKIAQYFDYLEPEYKKERERVLNQIYDLYPQYSSSEYQEHIKAITVEHLGRVDKYNVLKKLHKYDFEHEYKLKNELTTLLENKKVAEKTVEETVELAAKTSEQARGVLANYFWFRKAIISQLAKYISDNEKSEDLLHELFFKRYATETQASLKNCIWLLDDKFMRFSYFASEGVVSKVIDDIYGDHEKDHNSNKRMDLFIRYDREELADRKDCVIVEFKALGTTADEKADAASQVRRKYASSIRDHVPSVNNIFVYIVTEIDDILAKDLKKDDFTEAFTRHGYILNYYNPGNSANITFISASSIVCDAQDRHELFFKLLREEMTESERIGQ